MGEMTLQRLFGTPLLRARLGLDASAVSEEVLQQAIADLANSHTIDIAERPFAWRTRGWSVEGDDRIVAPGCFWLAAICVRGAEGEALVIEDPRHALLTSSDEHLAFAELGGRPLPLIETVAAETGVVAIVPGFIRLSLPASALRRSLWRAVALHPRPA
ncbi:hypothetical protein ACFSC3_13795 [Sphingomonas floccifaciens]|uniref:Uncharacterized protein n=1 Tax=Sphingomonas floccifaciens TaxID=1844115 RepID=A0ABW4NGG7_9SPHN